MQSDLSLYSNTPARRCSRRSSAKIDFAQNGRLWQSAPGTHSLNFRKKMMIYYVSKMVYYVSTIKALDHFNVTKGGRQIFARTATSANPHGSRPERIRTPTLSTPGPRILYRLDEVWKNNV